MTFEDTFGLALLKGELIRDEGLVLHVYKDPGSGHAIGIGRNLTTQGITATERAALDIRDEQLVEGGAITEAQAMGLLDFDIKDRCHQLDVYIPWWRLLSPARQRAILNMAFEMGSHGMLKSQPAFIHEIERGHYEQAAIDLEASEWFAKVPKRPARIVAMVRHG